MRTVIGDFSFASDFDSGNLLSVVSLGPAGSLAAAEAATGSDSDAAPDARLAAPTGGSDDGAALPKASPAKASPAGASNPTPLATSANRQAAGQARHRHHPTARPAEGTTGPALSRSSSTSSVGPAQTAKIPRSGSLSVAASPASSSLPSQPSSAASASGSAAAAASPSGPSAASGSQSGNTANRPSPVADYVFQLWTRPDGLETETPTKNRTWFHFEMTYAPRRKPARVGGESAAAQAPAPRISANGRPPLACSPSNSNSAISGSSSGAKDAASTTIEFRLMSLNKVKKLFGMGLRPVFRHASEPVWRRIPTTPVTKLSEDGSLQVNFIFTIASDPVSPQPLPQASAAARIGTRQTPAPPGTYYFAYCLPYSYSDLQRRLAELDTIFGSARLSSTVPAAASGTSLANGPEADLGEPDSQDKSRRGKGKSGPDSSAPNARLGRPESAAGRKSSMIPRLAKSQSRDRNIGGMGNMGSSSSSSSSSSINNGSAASINAKSSKSKSSPASIAAAAAASATARSIYFHRDVLVNSLDGHSLDLVTISSTDGMLPHKEPGYDGLFPNKDPSRRAQAFQMQQLQHSNAAATNALGLHVGDTPLSGKQYVYITARVHPAETIASYMLDGFMDFLLSTDPRAALLRSRFVFKVVPMLNPDGVVRGHYRGDLRGVNLNRVYVDPDPAIHPTIWAAKTYVTRVMAAAGRVQYYFDLHGHANKYGCFLFGNWPSDGDVEKQVAMLAFARCMYLNCPLFDLSECDFAPKGMVGSGSGSGVAAGAGGMAASGYGDAVDDEGEEGGSPVRLGSINSRNGDVPAVHQQQQRWSLMNAGSQTSSNAGISSSSSSSMTSIASTTPTIIGGRSIEATKDGTGRVAIYRELGIAHCYTFEANYYGCKVDRRPLIRHACDPGPSVSGAAPSSSLSVSSSSSDDGGAVKQTSPGQRDGGAARNSIPRAPTLDDRRFTLADMRAMGRSLAISVLDMEVPEHPWSRLPVADPLGMSAVQSWALERVRRMYAKHQVSQWQKKREARASARCRHRP
ncbi:hypothetical protein BC831DRAFT_465952 [Entophlyctis helioformis]|nr:hypothetical protein BC831DRAFT_465952 [Entophlyctis helioformis]